MTEIEEIRRVYEEELVPRLRSIRSAISLVNIRPESREATNQLLHENILQRLECIQQSVILHRRISALEADIRRSAQLLHPIDTSIHRTAQQKWTILGCVSSEEQEERSRDS